MTASVIDDSCQIWFWLQRAFKEIQCVIGRPNFKCPKYGVTTVIVLHLILGIHYTDDDSIEPCGLEHN